MEMAPVAEREETCADISYQCTGQLVARLTELASSGEADSDEASQLKKAIEGYFLDPKNT